MTYIFDHLGRKINTDHIGAVERLIRLKEKSASDPWPVIRECFNIWEKTRPKEYNAHLVYINDVRQTRKDRKYASTKDPKHGGYLRYTLDIPMTVMSMIRAIYNVDELPMDRKFYLEFAKRFPNYKVAEKL